MPVRYDHNAHTWFYRFNRNKLPFYKGGFHTKRQAQDAQARRMDEAIREEISPKPIGSELLFRDAAQWFLDEYSLKKKAEWMGDRGRIRYMQAFYCDKLMSQIRPSDVQKMLEDVVSRGRKPLTAHHYKSLMKAIYNRATKFGKYQGPNPAAQVEMLRVPKVRVRFLYPAEEKKLTPIVRENPRLWPYYFMGMNTGMRLGELCRVAVEDVSLALGHVFLPQTKTRRSRYVPIDESLRPFLASQMADKAPSTPLLGELHRNTISHWFTDLCKKAGVKNFTFHCIRHSFVAHLLMRREPIYNVAKIIGDSVKTTEEHYGHLSVDWLRGTIAKIGDAVSPIEDFKLQSNCSGQVLSEAKI